MKETSSKVPNLALRVILQFNGQVPKTMEDNNSLLYSYCIALGFQFAKGMKDFTFENLMKRISGQLGFDRFDRFDL